MSELFAIAITTGILSGIWGWLSITLGLITWAGFLGCTTYFASPIDGLKGLAISIATNLSGVFWAMVIIKTSSMAGVEYVSYFATGIVATFMCIQAKKHWLSFIPGTFIGCCATFATNGNWQAVIPALIVGAIFGYLMKATGLKLHKQLHNRANN
ncbi:DUF1097 domain-containing protein [Shewanella marina]|uniref:DUF1097 domain-containing protein n=1 Tax=Shewanella marina TaxID=487319 RepID=UPI0004714E5B|nr:DUF1097 domain-containing protein [Shewanella marina]